MTKKSSISSAHAHGEEEAEMACESCGENEGCCEGDACGSCGPSGCGGHGHGHGGMHGNWGHHKMFAGAGLIGLGALWYLKNVGTIPAAMFWPIVFGIAGLALLIKGWWLKRQEDECCGHC